MAPPVSGPFGSHVAGLGDNPEYAIDRLRIGYESMVTPGTVYDYDTATGTLTVLKVQEIPSGYDASQYATERLYAPARDGTLVPVSVVYKRDYVKDGTRPLHVYGYGAYGIAMPPSFSANRLSLLDRGFAYAIVHIRGGDDLGYQWYLDGKLEKRENTFNDFVDATRYLNKQGFGRPGLNSASGGSAGGWLMGVVVNQAPELWRAVVAHVRANGYAATLLTLGAAGASVLFLVFADHGLVGRILDRLQFFEVFSSVWFTAIYVLLFVSLVGCLTPRLIEHFRSLRATPVAAPRNLGRLPKHHTAEVPGGDLTVMAASVDERLRGWRRTTRTEGESTEISAEKGYLREFGNIVFHFSLLGLLVAIAAGKLFSYEGNVIVIADGGPGFCSASPAAFDSFRAGNVVDGTSLHPSCLRVHDFDARYLPSGQATAFAANIDYQEGADLVIGAVLVPGAAAAS